MNRILILGIGPLAFASKSKFHSGGNRAWHLAKPLLDLGFEVILVCFRVTDRNSPIQPLETIHQNGSLTYYEVDERQCFASDTYLREKILKHQPQAMIGACGYPASRAVTVAGDLPVWADLHGYPLGEAQAKAYHYQEQGYLHHFWNMHREVLRRADRFSVTSERQRMALIGELGTMGRLNGLTFMEPLVTQIAIAWDPDTSYRSRSREKNDRIHVFSSGGYNLWCDIDTLFHGLELAMQRDERVHFISTGGAIDGHDEKTYPRFQKLVEKSPLRDRFQLKGWVSREELYECQNQAHLGINVDLPCYESLIGARNRITEFMAKGIPILTTLASEISQILYYKNMALTVPMQNPQAIANEILLAANYPQRMDEMAADARKLFEDQYTFHRTVGELVEWCRNPKHSGDAPHYAIRLDYRYPEDNTPVTDSQRTLPQRIKSKIKRLLSVE